MLRRDSILSSDLSVHRRVFGLSWIEGSLVFGRGAERDGWTRAFAASRASLPLFHVQARETQEAGTENCENAHGRSL